MNKKDKLSINIQIEHINNEKFNIKKNPGLYYFPLRFNLTRQLFIADKLYYNNNIDDSHITFTYPNNLSRSQLIYHKIYDMSGLTADNKFVWYERFFTQIHNQNILYEEDDQDFSLSVYSRTHSPFKFEKTKMILFINEVVYLMLFLLDGVRDITQSLKESSLREYIINNCINYQKVLKANKKTLKTIDMYICIDDVIKYDELIIEHLIKYFEKDKNWSERKHISLSTAWHMHCELLQEFSIIKENKMIISIPRLAKFNLQLLPDYQITKVIAYLPQQSGHKYIWHNQYQNYYIYNNGIIIKKRKALDEMEEGGLEDVEDEADQALEDQVDQDMEEVVEEIDDAGEEEEEYICSTYHGARLRAERI